MRENSSLFLFYTNIVIFRNQQENSHSFNKNQMSIFVYLYSMSKVSIRFFNDREVRTLWDEEYNKWWFSVLDVTIGNT